MRLTRGCRAGGGVACSSLEYGGIRAAMRRTPAPHDRLLLPTTSPPPPHLVLLVHLCSTRLSRSHLPLYSPPGTSAQSCSSLLPLSRILHRLRTDNSDDDDDDVPISLRRIPPARCTFGKGIGKMDRRKEAGAEDRDEKEENRVYLSRITALGIHLSTSRRKFVDVFAGMSV